jgi:phage major head subunit gpT-like protein
MLITPQKLEAAFLAFSFVFARALNMVRPTWPMLASLVPSAGAENRYSWLSQAPRMREWVGERVIRSLAARVHVVKNRPFEGTIGLSLRTLETDQLGVFALTLSQWSASVGLWQDDLVISAIRDGYNRLCYDGQPMYDTAHPVDIDDASKGLFSNYYAGFPLTPDNFEYVYNDMATRKGEAGVEVGARPTHIIVPPQLSTRAKLILESDNVAAVFAGSTGQGTQTNTLKGYCQIIVVDRLSADPTKWYLAKLDGPVKPWIMQQHHAPRLVSRTALDDPHVFEKYEVLFGADAYGEADYSLPHLVSAAHE